MNHLNRQPPPQPQYWLSTYINQSLTYLTRLLYNEINIDPIEETRRFLLDFYGKYGAQHPAFRDSSYNDAVQFARSQFKMLVVYVHSDKHPGAQSFCQDVIFTDAFTRFIDENFIIWACDVRSSNGLKISNLLEATTYPYMALICCNNIPGLSNGSQTLRLESFQGSTLNSDNVVTLLTNAASTYEPSLIASKADHDQREMDRMIRMEQDEAYEMSLREDQEKERRAREAERLRQEEEDRVQREEEEREQAEKELKLRKQQKEQMFSKEPTGTDITRLAIRLVDGSRVQRSFYITDTVKFVMDYVDTKIDEPIEEFVLSTNYPK
ncbi:hypothetical protein SAMD00019534_093230, partial [Acytostelium subglobosum LB1]|uniref:hypothetical protein n=1 Tax=Acytostelium subglobosum LB1 TaxID=1410327 RepID=UPI000644A501